MRVTITASIRLLFILTLAVISIVAQTGLISASAPSPARARTTTAPETGLSRDCSIPETSSRWRVACVPRGPGSHALTDRASE